jgi:hypothetical protein
VIRDADHIYRRQSNHPTVHYRRSFVRPRPSSMPVGSVAFENDRNVFTAVADAVLVRSN